LLIFGRKSEKWVLEFQKTFRKIKEREQIFKKIVSGITVKEFAIKMWGDDGHCVRLKKTFITWP
jgi:hypothetical protein